MRDGREIPPVMLGSPARDWSRGPHRGSGQWQLGQHGAGRSGPPVDASRRLAAILFFFMDGDIYCWPTKWWDFETAKSNHYHIDHLFEQRDVVAYTWRHRGKLHFVFDNTVLSIYIYMSSLFIGLFSFRICASSQQTFVGEKYVEYNWEFYRVCHDEGRKTSRVIGTLFFSL